MVPRPTVSADALAKDGHVKYLNDDPTECCAFIPANPADWKPCEDPDAQPGCIVASPVDADFALVISGVNNKRACCMPTGSCLERTQAWCDGHGGVFHCDQWCATPQTTCSATQ